jgi:hypothetical protein
MNRRQFLVDLSAIGITGLAFSWKKIWLESTLTKPLIFDSVFDLAFDSIALINLFLFMCLYTILSPESCIESCLFKYSVF